MQPDSNVLAVSASACSVCKSAAQQHGAHGSGGRHISQCWLCPIGNTPWGQAASRHHDRTAHLKPPTGGIVTVVVPGVRQRVAARSPGACPLLRHSLELGVQ